jgi:hypothetical protein
MGPRRGRSVRRRNRVPFEPGTIKRHVGRDAPVGRIIHARQLLDDGARRLRPAYLPNTRTCDVLPLTRVQGVPVQQDSPQVERISA